MDSEKKERLENIWLRLLFMVLYFIAHRLASWLLFLVSALQFILVLIQQKENGKLLEFAGSLTQFIYQTGRFLSFLTDEKPFPFSDWPALEARPEQNQDSDT